jgi:hypothetical protein
VRPPRPGGAGRPLVRAQAAAHGCGLSASGPPDVVAGAQPRGQRGGDC